MFLYTGESVRFNKNAHCFAVEPSGWRYAFDASIFVTLFRRFAPSDSPRVHQKTTATAVVFVYGGVRAFKQKRTLLRSRTLRLALRFRCKHLRFAIASRRSFRLPPGTPKNNRNRGCFCIRGSPCVLIKRTLLCSRTLPAIRNVPKAHIAPQAHRFCQRQKHRIIASVLTPRKNRPKYGRFFVVWIYCFLLNNALLILLLFVEQCFDCGN